MLRSSDLIKHRMVVMGGISVSGKAVCCDCVGALSFVFLVKFKVKFYSCPLMFRAEYKDCGAGEQHLQSGTTSNWYLNI